MIEVIDEKPIPYYEVECYECKSRLRYTRKDVSICHINCPVCGCSNHVIPIEDGQAGFYTKDQLKASLLVNVFNNKKTETNQ